MQPTPYQFIYNRLGENTFVKLGKIPLIFWQNRKLLIPLRCRPFSRSLGLGLSGRVCGHKRKALLDALS